MNTRFTYQDIHLSSIRQINALPGEVKYALYSTLIPGPVVARYGMAGALSTQFRCPPGTSLVEIDLRHPADLRDALLYFQMADTPNGQVQVLLMVINDPFAPRFDVDRDWKGEYTKLGTMSRNIPAEIKAMQAGLAPGQVRQGLRLCHDLIPVLEKFIIGLGKDRFFIEPLSYHSAIQFERYGFAYLVGRRKMEQIHTDFQPDGVLHRRLDGSTSFRQPGFERTVRGRSWAIHDGILGEPWGGVKMYKRVGVNAEVCTFPGAVY